MRLSIPDLPPRRRATSTLLRTSAAAAIAAAGLAVVSSGTTSAAGSVATVTSAADAGPGSLRDALAAAQSDPGIRRIVISPTVGTIAPVTPLTFEGSQTLAVDGANTTIDGAAIAAGDVLTLTSPNISVSRLAVDSGPDDGLVLLGANTIRLSHISAQGNAAQGVLVDDLGSPGGIDLAVVHSTFDDNGIGVCDTDGMRVNETGTGSIDASFIGVTALDNDHDGIELDEKGDGDVRVSMSNSSFTDNGYNDCTEPEVDLEDGFDVDEFGPGDLVVDITNSSFTHNAEEGLDLDEGDDEVILGDGTLDGPGDLSVSLSDVDTSNNGHGAEEDNIDIDEVGDGNYDVKMVNVTSNGAFNDGYDGSESGPGDLSVTLVNSSFSGSADGRGVDLAESDTGSFVISAVNVAADDNDSDGLRGEEENAGGFSVNARNSSFARNGSDSLDLSKEEAPAGTLQLRNTQVPDGLNLDNVDEI